MTSKLKEYKQYILEVLDQAEERLAARLNEAARSRQYDALAELVSVSQQLRDLIQSVARPEQCRNSEDPGGSGGGKSPGPDNGKQGPNRDYPRFVRSKGRLIKVGRSRTSSREYRHRAPKSSVRAVVAALRDLADRREHRDAFETDFHQGLTGTHEFSVNRLMPVRDANGAEVPHYQVSLIVAWLQTLGTVRKSGRGRYVVVRGCLSAAELEQHWDELVDASAQGDVSDR